MFDFLKHFLHMFIFMVRMHHDVLLYIQATTAKQVATPAPAQWAWQEGLNEYSFCMCKCVMCFCVGMCVHTCAGAHVYVLMCEQRPEADMEYFLNHAPLYLLRQGFLVSLVFTDIV